MENERVEIGSYTHWGDRTLTLSDADRAYHVHIIGRSGMGKTTLLKEMLRQDIEQGKGCALIDPHGDIADELLDLIPSHRIDDVVYIDPSLKKFRTIINPFYKPPADPNAKALIGYNVVSTFKHLWHDAWSDTRLQYILTNITLALLDADDRLRPTLASIPLVLVDEQYRSKVVACIENDAVRRFFTDEMGEWDSRYLTEAIGPVQNRIGQFLTHPALRQTFGIWQPTIDFRSILDGGKILIVRIPKGTLGEEPTNYFGSFTMSGIQVAAMGRAEQKESERRPFYLYVDEFQNVGTDATAQMFSEARKFGLSLTVCHQYINQLEDTVRDAVFGNVGSYISFRVREKDAEILANEIDGFSANIITGLGRGEVVAQVLEGSAPSEPRLAKTNAPGAHAHGHAAKIKQQSRKRYCVRADAVEQTVTAWLSQFGQEESPAG